MYTASDHTFVICAYKENPFLEQTVVSLKAQSALGSIILSTSTPNNYLEDICMKYDIEMVINRHPHLAGDDWNYGYDQAKTPLVTMAHQDDYYESVYLERCLEELNCYAATEVSLVFSDYYELRNNQEVRNNSLLKIKRVMNSPLAHRGVNGSIFLKRRVLSFGCSICCPSVLLVKPVAGSNVFNTTYKNSCDYQTWVDLASRRGRFVYISDQLMGHRIYEESATSKNLDEDIRRNEDLEILSKLWPAAIARGVNALYAKSEKSNQL